MLSEKQEPEICYEKLKTENALLQTSSKSNTSDEVDKLHTEVKVLTEDLSKFVKSTNNLNILLRYSRDLRDKSGLGYQDTDKKFLKKLLLNLKLLRMFTKRTFIFPPKISLMKGQNIMDLQELTKKDPKRYGYLRI